MNNTYISILVILLFAMTMSAQTFRATIDKDGNNLIVKLQPNGADITSGFSTFEVHFRVAKADAVLIDHFGTPISNVTDFPDLTGAGVSFVGADQNGVEPGFVHYWFSWQNLNQETSNTYLANTEYEIFRVPIFGDETMDIDVELVHNENFSPSYIAMSGGGMDRFDYVTNDLFYGPNTDESTDMNGITTFSVAVENIYFPIISKPSLDILTDNKDVHLESNVTTETDCDNLEVDRSKDDVNLEVFPNPTNDFVQIEITGIDDVRGERPILRIFENGGKLVRSIVMNSHLYELDITNMPSMSYHFMVSYCGQNYIRKVIKID